MSVAEENHFSDPPHHKGSSEQIENAQNYQSLKSEKNLVYDKNEEEPEIHARTYFALSAMFFLNLVQVFGLIGPPAGLSFIETDLNNKATGTWVPNALSLVQAVLAPLISSTSDTFQVRKALLVGTAVISFIGCAIAPGSKDIYRLIVAQVLIGFGFAAVPLAYCVPSEILPRKWRPMVQAFMNIAAALGACAAPLVIGGLTSTNAHTGWRNFYWIQMALWGTTAVCLFVGYRPPKRHTRLDHLTFMQKLGRLDLPGFFFLASGLTLLLTGLNLGGGLFPWASATVLVTLIIGIFVLIVFGLYEWKFTKTGILHHDLFKGESGTGSTFAICIILMFIEGILLFSYVIFYPTLTSTVFEMDPFLQTARQAPYWIAAGCSTVIYGYISTKFKTVRWPMFTGFLIFTGGIAGMATIQPHESFNSLAFSALAGFGFGAPLILIIAGVQLATPHNLIATATAATTCSRAVAVAVFTAIFSAALDTRLKKNIPAYVAAAASKNGLPKASLADFIKYLQANNGTALRNVPGVDNTIVMAGTRALKQAYADGIRVVFITAAPFGILACVICLFLGNLKGVMNYGVDAPVEDLRARRSRTSSSA